jgi:formate-dependent nitrite reductase cytochrome c552 subunit
VTIRKPDGPPTIPTGTFDEKGRPVAVACAACHATKPANADARLGTPLPQFHSGLVGQHGNLTCVSCHNPADGYGTLRLADGRSVPYREVMTLCAQCHGPQHRDYLNGAHGGMTGYWDLSKGGRVRNNCIHCHDPHAPKYPTVSPAAGPSDRFLHGGGHD